MLTCLAAALPPGDPEALQLERRAIELEPTNAGHHSRLSWHLSRAPGTPAFDPEQALALAQRAIELAPGEGYSWNASALALYRLGRFEECAAACRRSLEEARRRRAAVPEDADLERLAREVEQLLGEDR